MQAGPTTVIITGEGGETEGLSDLLSESLGCSVKCYIPETLGGRNAGLTAPLGLYMHIRTNFLLRDISMIA